MIVNALQEGWEVITQRAHALLAAELIAPWRAEQRPDGWVTILAALVQHDDEENYWEQTDHLSAIGTPVNFDQIGVERSMHKERAVIRNALHQDIWVALLISRHNTYIYEDMRGQDKRVTAFLDEQEDNRRKWLKMMGIKREALETAYSFMGYGDRLSLILCQRQLPDKERRLEILVDPQGQRHEVYQRADGSVGLEPYPYDADAVTVGVDRRLLSQTTFPDTLAFRKTVEAAEVERCTWTIRRA